MKPVCIILVTYIKPLSEVEKYLTEHRAFLDRQFAAGRLLATGPQDPREGGVILTRTLDRTEAEELIREDPFYIHGIADYRIVAFQPNKMLPALSGQLQGIRDE